MYISKRTIAIILILGALLLIVHVSVLVYDAVQFNREFNDFKEGLHTEDYWGAFTNARITSSDGKYTASYSSMYMGEYETSMVIVDIRYAETGRLASSFMPARSSDFWGICWEEGTHNIWIQSGDIGVQCYAKDVAQWVLDEDAVRPDSIVSKYD